MKRISLLFVISTIIGIMFACQRQPSQNWKLVWEEQFDVDGMIDQTVWSKIPRGRSEWNLHMSDYDSLYDVKNGSLILRGIVNPSLSGDTMPYITGGIYSKDKKGFYRGKIEISAKFQDAKGAWPALWLLPFDNAQWPHGGELDIVERLNYDSVVYQTVHSNYIDVLGQKEPDVDRISPIPYGAYNTYGVELYADSVVFTLNGQRTFSYPRIETKLEGQFPFDRSYYLLMDMQLGGNWVGEVDPGDLPVEMHIDWVRFYEWK